ncbi:MAG: RdgB/HAM1 family non-canonical purine NTP pyrophosphatase [Bdellovibrionales bacterium]|nr:RdgB/HAM1 family non-canonical purine NTP pyrophosphatase [Bdellovibrionales bacterium]
MVIWVATENKGKLSEFKLLLDPLKLDIHSQSELSYFSPPPENGDSFLANARIKTRALKALKKEFWVVGEDSGLEVEGLGNLPGIHSARYAGPKAGDRENVAKLLKMMELRSFTNRKARFKCVMVAYSPDGQEHVMEGLLQGELAKKATGTSGFGYDPVFIPEGQTKTIAELGLAFKNQVSHRAQALQQLVKILEGPTTV